MAYDPQDRYRSAHIDSLEERLVLSAQPAMDLYLDSFLTSQVESATAELAPSIADVHEFTGVAAVQEAYQFTGAGQTIAVIDTGIAYDHYALGGGFGAGYRVVGGWDFAENDANPYDDGPAGFHGTHVAGIVGSSAVDHLGVAPEADLVALRVFDDQGRATFDWVESALQWVHDHRNDFENPITTVNLSLGVDWNQDYVPNWAMLEDEFAQLKNDGIFIAVAAGNSFANYQSTGLSYPAASPLVVPVASVGDDGLLSDFSQRHERVIAAPGEAIASTIPNHLFGDATPSDRFLALSGTSMASPYLAGSSMLLRQAMESAGYSNIDQDMLYQQFRDTADEIWDSVTQSSYLRLNLRAAVDSIFAHLRDSDSPTPTDLGVIDDYQFSEIEIDGTRYYELRAMHDGVMAVTANAQQGAVHLTAFDADMNVVRESITTAIGSRLGLTVSKGDTLLIEAEGEARDVEFHFSNVIERQGNRIHVHGTAGDDIMRVVFNDKLRVQVNGMNYGFDLTKFHQLRIFGDHGVDELQVLGSDQQDVAQLHGQDLRWKSNDFLLLAERIEQYRLDSGQGFDLLRLRDTAGDDRVIASPELTLSQGALYSAEATGFDEVRAFGGEGRDTGYLSGSSGDDRFFGRSNRSSLISSGWKGHLFNFDVVQGAGGEGNDRAFVFGTAADDVFTVTPDFGHLDGHAYSVGAEGFRRTFLNGGGGADQFAYSTAISVDNVSVASTQAVIRGDGYCYIVRDVDVAHAMGLQHLNELSGQSLRSEQTSLASNMDPHSAWQDAQLATVPTIATHQFSAFASRSAPSLDNRYHDAGQHSRIAAVHSEPLGSDSFWGDRWPQLTSAYGNEVSPYFWDLLGEDGLASPATTLDSTTKRDDERATYTNDAPSFEPNSLKEPDCDDIVTTIQHEMECLEFLFDLLAQSADGE